MVEALGQAIAKRSTPEFSFVGRKFKVDKQSLNPASLANLTKTLMPQGKAPAHISIKVGSSPAQDLKLTNIDSNNDSLMIEGLKMRNNKQVLHTVSIGEGKTFSLRLIQAPTRLSAESTIANPDFTSLDEAGIPDTVDESFMRDLHSAL